MGDILHSLPAVTALRLAHPGWFLGWAVEPRWQALLAAGPGPAALVDRIHPVDSKRWARSPLHPGTIRQILELRRDLRSCRYDLCIDLQGAVRSALVGRLARPRRMLGEDSPREPLARLLFPERIPTSGVHVIEQAIEVCRAAAGENLEAVRPWLPVDADAEAWADGVLRENGGPMVLIAPGAGWGAKRWPAERYGTVAAALHAAGYRALINEGPGESRLADAVAEASGGQAQALALTLPRLISLTRRVRLVIAGDTGPLHLACALGKPVVGVFGPTEPRRNGPFGVPFRVLRHPESRRDHSRHQAPEAGLLTIAADEVVQAALQLLQPAAAAQGEGGPFP